jgi:clan AA aspartic protease
LWQFVDGTPVIPISVNNTLLDLRYPQEQDATVLAILDTGYSGFLYIPQRLFDRLGFPELRTKSAKATLADGTTLKLTSAYGSLSIPSLHRLTVEGIIETSKGAQEILIGMRAIRSLIVELNCCGGTTDAEECSS